MIILKIISHITIGTYFIIYYQDLFKLSIDSFIRKNFSEYIKIKRINPFASPCVGAPELKYGDVNIVTPSPGEVNG